MPEPDDVQAVKALGVDIVAPGVGGGALLCAQKVQRLRDQTNPEVGLGALAHAVDQGDFGAHHTQMGPAPGMYRGLLRTDSRQVSHGALCVNPSPPPTPPPPTPP